MKKDDLVIVDAPSKYANSTLNGSLAKVNFVGEEVVNVTFVSGEMSGREWQMSPAHVRLANKSMHLTLGSLPLRVALSYRQKYQRYRRNLRPPQRR